MSSICNYQRRDKLDADPTYDVSDEQCLKINILRFSGHMLNRTEKQQEEVISLESQQDNPAAAAILFFGGHSVFVNPNPFVIIVTTPLNG